MAEIAWRCYTFPGMAIRTKIKSLLAVPGLAAECAAVAAPTVTEALMHSMACFSTGPAVTYAWCDAMADLLEVMRRQENLE